MRRRVEMVLRGMLFFVAVTFAFTSLDVARGSFEESGLPINTLVLHAWVNGLESLGWLVIFLFGFGEGAGGKIFVRKHSGGLAVFLAGMWCWDMITTVNLVMPTPPYQIVWGPLSVAIMLLLAYQLRLNTRDERSALEAT